MDQKTFYIILGAIVIILIALWAFKGRDVSAPSDAEMATTTVGATPGNIPDGTYSLSTDESVIGWKGYKPLVLGYEDTGTVQLTGGSLTVLDGRIVSGDFTVNMKTIAATKTGNEKDGGMLVQHLMSDDFFAVETYPTARFGITGVANGVVSGDLTVKNVTKPISFPAVIALSGDRLTATASITLNRAEWDVRYGSDTFFDNLGDSVIGDDISITLDLVAMK